MMKSTRRIAGNGMISHIRPPSPSSRYAIASGRAVRDPAFDFRSQPAHPPGRKLKSLGEKALLFQPDQMRARVVNSVRRQVGVTENDVVHLFEPIRAALRRRCTKAPA